ncbi:MAG TPA: hypothetical protein VMT15_09760 [Bryobacteraceae bacterium]|nr:hypothetical protein [Bryobacteraceae bacterium]
MKKRLIVLACSIASTAVAQIGGGYLGPAVLSGGATGIGNRGGEQVDLRFFAGVNGTYDSSQEPAAIDSKGNLITTGALYGVQASWGAYGSHRWKMATLGLDYHGSWSDYIGGSTANANNSLNQSVQLGYTWQESRRIKIDARVTGGIFNGALGGLGFGAAYNPSDIVQPSTLLFDEKTYYLQGGLNATYIQSPRTSYTFGGQGFENWQQSSQLVGMLGYSATGSVEHKLSKYTSFGFTYSHNHYDYKNAYGQSDIDMGQLFIGTSFARVWSITLQAGVYHAEVTGEQSVTLNPVIAALLGQTSTIQAFYEEKFGPSGGAVLTRKFKQGSLSVSYNRGISPGNGVYLTSESESLTGSYSYTGIRKVGLSVSGGYNRLSSIGQGIEPYRTAYGGAGFTYTLPLSLHFTARYDYRYNQIENYVYKNVGSAVSAGLSFSPGTIPLSIW